MKDTIILTEIKGYLARLKTEVTISNSSNETDINIHAENIVRRILSILFESNILNSGRSIKKNNESFDLFDAAGHFAFQVTSTNVNKKIIDSISSFVDYSWNEKFKELYIILIGYDKKQYNRSTINKINSIINKRFVFDVKKNIVDINDLYDYVKELNDVQSYVSVRDILKEQFDEVLYNNNITKDIVEFFEEYRNSINVKYRRINFFGLDVSSKPSEVDLEALFVPSNFKKHSKVLPQDIFIDIDLARQSSFKLNFPKKEKINEVIPKGIPGITVTSEGIFTDKIKGTIIQ